MKNQVNITIRMPEDVAKKLAIVSKAEGRTLNNEFLLLARNSIQYFERVKGNISQKSMDEIDLSTLEEK